MSFNAHFHEVAAEVRNWGRWGESDRLGTLNLLTDEAVLSEDSVARQAMMVVNWFEELERKVPAP